MQTRWVISCLIIKAGREGLSIQYRFKVCKPSSLYQTQVRITRMLIIYYSMEDLVTLHYRNFSILAKQEREFAQRTHCSNWVADPTLKSKLFLHKLWWEHLGWSTTQKQEWGLFFLQYMLYNAATMQRTEHQRHYQGSQSEATDMAPKHPSM